MDAGGVDVGDCTDVANPCATITYALGQSAPGDAIEIADGEYTEFFAIDKDVALHGESEAGTIIQADVTSGTATQRVITIDGSHVVEISDLTVRHGVASGDFPASAGGGIYVNGATLTASDVRFLDNEATASGGGVYFESSSHSFAQVTFSGNVASFGGGMYNGEGNIPTLLNVTFSENTANLNAGGMYNAANTSPVLQNVEFIDNETGNQGGGMFNASSIGASVPTLTNVTFDGNIAGQSGGGMLNSTRSFPKLENVDFLQNEAGDFGGGMLNAGSISTLSNVTFSGNAASFGGGMYNTGSSPTLANVAFVGNEAVGAGGGMLNTSSSPNFVDGLSTFTNVAFGGNSAGNIGGAMSNTSVSDWMFVNTIVWGNTAGNGGNDIFNGPDAAVTLIHGLHLMRFTLTMSRASDQPVTVDFATQDGTAVAGVDYFAASGTVTFDPGETSAGIFVAIIANTVPQSNRNFFVNLSNPGGATIDDDSALGTIFDDDVPEVDRSAGNGGSRRRRSPRADALFASP